MWSRGGNRPAPNPFRRLLQVKLFVSLAFLLHFSCTSLTGKTFLFLDFIRFVEHRFPLCRKPEELLASCYTQYFTFWNGSGDPGEHIIQKHMKASSFGLCHSKNWLYYFAAPYYPGVGSKCCTEDGTTVLASQGCLMAPCSLPWSR